MAAFFFITFMAFMAAFFFHLLLPPIILYAGYSLEELHGHVFFSNIRSICTFAVLGTLLSTVVVSLLAWAAAAGGVVQLSLTECWIFGALISAIDPVSTLSIFESSHVEEELFNLVFGESILNDATAIVLFSSANRFAKPDFPPTAGNIGKVIGGFFAYSAAEAAHLSGIITILLYGIFLGHYGKRSMGQKDRIVTGSIARILGWVLEGVVFISV